MNRDIYEEVTNKIVAQLETGVKPWQKPWAGTPLKLPMNEVTQKHYNGINIPLLWLSADLQNFTSHDWASYKQWAGYSQQVKKGEKGTMIVKYDTFQKEKDGVVENIPFIKCYTVFNACQLEGYKQEMPIAKSLIERVDMAEHFVENTKAVIKHDGGDKAYYSKTTDDIHLPVKEMFRNTEGYYATELHELSHWTGHTNRCNRDMGKRFGDNAYAFEELVAELSAAFLCASLGITDEPRPDHADYLANWLTVFKSDKKAIFTASSEASKACGFLDKLQS